MRGRVVGVPVAGRHRLSSRPSSERRSTGSSASSNRLSRTAILAGSGRFRRQGVARSSGDRSSIGESGSQIVQRCAGLVVAQGGRGAAVAGQSHGITQAHALAARRW